MMTKEERATYMRLWRTKNRDHWNAVRREKSRWNFYEAVETLGGCCVDCGYKQDLRALQFDHVPPRLGKGQRLSTAFDSEAWRKEAKKCQLVCANCHAIRTAKSRAVGWLG